MPVYNEARGLEAVVRRFYSIITREKLDATFIIAEDGSTDGTKDILDRLKREFSFVLISGHKRKGYAQAFLEAMRLPETALIFFCDSDGQHDPEDLLVLLKEIDSSDLVSGCRVSRRDPFYRLFMSRAYNLLINFLFGVNYRDINSGFKLIKKSVVDDVLPEMDIFEYCVMTEFVLRAHAKGYRIKEATVRHFPRMEGSTSIFRFSRLPHIAVSLVRSMAKLKRRI